MPRSAGICSVPGCPNPAHRRGRCTLHPNDHRPDDPAVQRRNSAAWKRLSRQIIDAHVAAHGPTCPGWHRPAHRVAPADLTTDHLDPLQHGRDTGRYAVLCRPCNSAKGTGSSERVGYHP